MVDVIVGGIEGNTNKPIVYRVKVKRLLCLSFETKEAFNSFTNLTTLIMNHGQFAYYNPEWAEIKGVHMVDEDEMIQIEDVANILFDIKDVPIDSLFLGTRGAREINLWHKENGRIVYHGKQSNDE